MMKDYVIVTINLCFETISFIMPSHRYEKVLINIGVIMEIEGFDICVIQLFAIC